MHGGTVNLSDECVWAVGVGGTGNCPGHGKFPRNSNRYLKNASNKVELFHYLSVAIAQTVFREGNVVISTLDENVLGSPVPGADESEYPPRPCNHDEFDTRR